MSIVKPKRPVLLYGVLGALAFAGLLYGKLRLDARNRLLAEADSGDPRSKVLFRPPIKPQESSWQPTITRVRLPSYQVADMTDNGVFLLVLNAGSNGPQRTIEPLRYLRTYQLLGNGISQQVDMKTDANEIALSPTGKLVSFSKSMQNYWTLHYEQKGLTTIDASAIRRTLKDGSRIAVDSRGLILTKNGVSTALRQGHYAADVHRTTVQSIVEHGDDDSIWVFENAGQAGAKFVPHLVRIQGKQAKEYPLPFRDTYVQSLAQTGDTIIATLGSLMDREPNRAYRWSDEKWVELPIPDGYVFSMIKKITYDGLAIGVVRDLGLKTMPVVWRDNECYPLQNAPNWPKYDSGTQIIAAARNGNVYVQPVFDKVPGSGEPSLDLSKNSYVLNIRK